MSPKYHLNPKPAPSRFYPPGPYGIIEMDGCLNCAHCIKKFCVYGVYRQRRYDHRQMFDTADSLCRNCFRCVQGCYGGVLYKSKNPEFWSIKKDLLMVEGVERRPEEAYRKVRAVKLPALSSLEGEE